MMSDKEEKEIEEMIKKKFHVKSGRIKKKKPFFSVCEVLYCIVGIIVVVFFSLIFMM